VRAGLLGLLANIGGGDDTELGESFDRSRGTRETDEEWQTYIDERKRAREARALVAAQFSIFLEALDDPDNEVRQFATWALLVCEAQAHIIVQAIQHRFEVELSSDIGS
jgi:succinate dehydrogenase flavin-adding protein (antitoxin of CptAB toxin-antitoxin module)